MSNHVFISYSDSDALEFPRKLADELEGGEDAYINAWFDKRDVKPGRDGDDQIAEGIRSCKCMAFVMTKDSTASGSICKNEWTWALKYKKPVIPIQLERDAEQPFGLGNRQPIDFSGEFEAGLAKLRMYLRRMDSPEGQLDILKDRLADAQRDQRRARPEDKPRIQLDIEELTKQIETQEKIVENPKAAQEERQKSIEAGLERERQPEKPAAKTSTKFINPPPGLAPNYFQDRKIETEQVVNFLNDDALRLMTVVGRSGVGKTALICRLLKGLEAGELPDGHGEMKAEGIVYLSESGSHRVNFTNIFYDLCKLLPAETAQELDTVYKNPQANTESTMRAVLEKFESGRVVLLLDYFDPLVDSSQETFAIRDSELDEALRAFLNGTHTAVKVLLTTRAAPRTLNLIQPGRQRVLTLDEGLESPYAENILREMDSDGLVGLKSASDDLLNRARERTRGYPRALEALFAILASDRYTTLEELLAMPTPENVVEAMVGEAYNRLDLNAEMVMQALAIYNRPVVAAAVDYLLAPHIPTLDSAPILQRLANMHFARKESGRFYLHPVDREFAISLMPEGSFYDRLRSGRGLDLLQYYFYIFNKFPDLLENPESFQQAEQESPPNFLKDVIGSIQSLDPALREKMRDEKNFEDETYLAALDQFIKVPQVWTRYALTLRAADYFVQARKPRAEWEKLDDLAAQLAEFDLRCTAGDYDTAAYVLLEIDSQYLNRWGHYRLVIDLHLRVKGNITDENLRLSNLFGLGNAYVSIGNLKEALALFEEGLNITRELKIQNWEGPFLTSLGITYSTVGDKRKAIEFFEQSLTFARESGFLESEGVCLTNLGNTYADLGDPRKAIEYHQQTLMITRESGNQRGESIVLGNIGHDYRDMNDLEQAIPAYQQAIKIGDDISFPVTQSWERWGLAQVYLFQNDPANARTTIEEALQFDLPEKNHDVNALLGIIALRQGERQPAQEAFTRSVAQANEILAKTPEYYEALDANGLSICGLILAGRGDPSMPTEVRDESRRVALTEAVETFRKARKIAPHAGVVKRVLRLFDELVKCDEEGILKDVRSAVEGKE
jgi:tetratricopeptide (TPR) repeat protein